jgi:hypothetical protein
MTGLRKRRNNMSAQAATAHLPMDRYYEPLERVTEDRAVKHKLGFISDPSHGLTQVRKAKISKKTASLRRGRVGRRIIKDAFIGGMKELAEFY